MITKLPLYKINALYGVFNLLDQYTEVVEQADGTKKEIKLSCSFGGRVGLDIARAKKRLQPELTAFQEAQQQIADELKIHISPAGGALTPSPESPKDAIEQFAKRRDELWKADIEVVLPKLKEDDLRIDKNRIPVSALQVLDELEMLEA